MFDIALLYRQSASCPQQRRLSNSGYNAPTMSHLGQPISGKVLFDRMFSACYGTAEVVQLIVTIALLAKGNAPDQNNWTLEGMRLLVRVLVLVGCIGLWNSKRWSFQLITLAALMGTLGIGALGLVEKNANSMVSIVVYFLLIVYGTIRWRDSVRTSDPGARDPA